MTFERARAVLHDGLAARAFPAAVCQVGHRSGPIWTEAFGTLSYAPDSPPATAETVFDLASLTKVIATTSIAMAWVRRDQLSVETPVSRVLPEWRGDGRDAVTVGHLLEHSSGLPAHLRLWECDDEGASSASGVSATDRILATPLERPVGSASVYSDVGFMLLGLVLERVGGQPWQPLDVQWDALWAQHQPDHGAADWLGFRPEASRRSLIAPTEVKPGRGGLVQGEVHDENTAFLGGVAAQAGLFGAAGAVGTFASAVLASFHEETWLATPDLMRRFARRGSVPGSSRALGWDTMLPTSSCGSRLSPSAIGHTGFTGTSLWIDWERDLYFVLLTNRVHPTRENEIFLPYRGRFHDAVMSDLADDS